MAVLPPQARGHRCVCGRSQPPSVGPRSPRSFHGEGQARRAQTMGDRLRQRSPEAPHTNLRPMGPLRGAGVVGPRRPGQESRPRGYAAAGSSSAPLRVLLTHSKAATRRTGENPATASGRKRTGRDIRHFRGVAWPGVAVPPLAACLVPCSVSVRPSVPSAQPRQARSEQPTMGWGGGGGCTPRPPIHQQPPERRVVTVVFLGLLLDLLAFTLLLPLLPRLLESHGRAHDPLYGSWQGGVDWFATAIGMPVEKRYNSVLFGGLIGSAFSVLQFLCAPLTGATSDCLGRRPVMLLCLMGVATSYAVWATSRSFAAFLASRLIGGISKGNVSLSTAIVADLGSPLARSQGMAVIGVAFSLGFTLGPMLGASLPLEMAPWFALLFAASDLLFIFCFLPETLPLEKRAPSMALGFRDAADLLSPLALLRFSAVARGQDPPSGDRLSSLRRLGLVYFLYLFLFSGLEYTLSFLTHQRFQFSSLQQGKMFFLIGLTMATIQGAYARRIHPGGEVAAVKRALLLLVPAFLLIGWGRSLPVLGLGLLLYSFAAAVVVPCLSSVVAGYGSPGQKGTVMGTLRSLGALARAAGPLVAASVYWLAGAQACFTTWSGLFLLPFFLLQKLSYPAQTLKAE
ncbi:major facilitator superfamily domain-containing protein 10 isoform X2 [Pan paniscus]|nr:major facilitator superfamily domain-containing protein 10 isoform X2 [Pan paniscus]